eukprot:SAG11_NODE_34318_length_272_cov_1.468208_1_plen_29_part_10
MSQVGRAQQLASASLERERSLIARERREL